MNSPDVRTKCSRRSAVSPLDGAAAPLRISAMRFTGTSIRWGQFGRAHPERLQTSRSVSPGWMGSRVMTCLLIDGSRRFQRWSGRGFPPAIRNRFSIGR